jgi:hypothetical protein
VRIDALLVTIKGLWVPIFAHSHDQQVVIWEIILRDFWGDILRTLVLLSRVTILQKNIA